MSSTINAKRLRASLPEVVGGALVLLPAFRFGPGPPGSCGPARSGGAFGVRLRRPVVARDIFFRYLDKSYSFTECTSFVVMRELKLKDALTTDRHFRQMGFNIVPRLRARV